MYDSRLEACVKSYKDLEVWQEGMDLAVAVYGLTRDFPAGERFGLTQQLRRASVSSVSNVAEGYGRRTNPQRYQFLQNALGSAYEVETQLLLALRVGAGRADDADECLRLVKEVGRKLAVLMKFVQSDQPRF